MVVATYALAALVCLGYFIDDSFITYRYGRNLASGLGVVFNPGERVEGYTDFSWVILSALSSLVGLDPQYTLPLVGLGCGFATLTLVFRAGRRLAPRGDAGDRWGGVFGAAIMATTAAAAFYAVTGLETLLFTLLNTVAVLALLEGRPARFGVAAGLGFLTRPEGAIIGALGSLWLVADALRRDRSWRPALRGVGALAAIVLPYVAWKRWYFGSLVPNTLWAKSPDRVVGWAYLWPVMLASSGLLVAALASLRDRAQRPATGLLVGLWLVWLVAVWWEGGDWMPSVRFVLPAMPFLALAADGGLVDLLFSPRPRGRSVARAVAVLALGAWAAWNVGDLRSARDTIEVMESGIPPLLRLSYALKSVGVRSAALVDIGRVGYETRWRIFDIAGLVDPVIARVPGAHGRKHFPIAHFAARRPDVVILRASSPPKQSATAPPEVDLPAIWDSEGWIASSRWFRDHYHYECTVPLTSAMSYVLFERNDRRGSEPRAPIGGPGCFPIVLRPGR